MAKTVVANTDTFAVSTPSDVEIVITRLFNAPPALVFDALTKPEHVKQWWGVFADHYVSVCEIDLRVGGAWRFVSTTPRGEVAFRGVYRAIERPGRLVNTEIFEMFPDTESVVTTTLTREGTKTRLTAVCAYPSKAVRDTVLGSGMEVGAAASYDAMETLLAAERPASQPSP
ncbi:MAG: SRPBCC family protein [Myxococcales bacterium]|nr:SRPBCC family protein [Myxococcales bacterium]